MDVLGKRKAKMDAEDAEAAADQYGAILIHRDPSVSDVPIFEKDLLTFLWVRFHDRPGSGGQRPPRVSVAMAISASGLW